MLPPEAERSSGYRDSSAPPPVRAILHEEPTWRWKSPTREEAITAMAITFATAGATLAIAGLLGLG